MGFGELGTMVTGGPAVAVHAVAVHDVQAFAWTRFQVHPSVLVGCLLLAAVYLSAIGPLRRRLGIEPRVSRWRIASFLGGVLVLFLSLNGPIHDLSDGYLFSAHMFQHLLLMLIMPPLLIVGIPGWLVRQALRHRGVARIARLLTHPVLAFVVYNLVFIGWHIPRFYDWALVSHDLHIAQHLMFMAAATMMWWPAMSPTPELQRIPEGLPQMAYLFAYAIPTTAVSAFITMSESVLYPFYGEAMQAFGLTPLEDQRLGGLIMWIPGMLIFWVAITVIFFRWNREEIRSWGRPTEEPAS